MGKKHKEKRPKNRQGGADGMRPFSGIPVCADSAGQECLPNLAAREEARSAEARPPEPPPPEPLNPLTPESLNPLTPEPLNPSPSEPLPRSRLRRLLPDIIWVTVAVAVIGLGIAIWLKPPLFRNSFPYVSYTFGGETFTNAVLYHPLAVPARFYVGLPEKLAGRYQWFTIDRMREIVALADGPPTDTFFGWPAVKRNALKHDAPLGLDLEFRTLDDSQWLIFFFKDAIVFSNNILCVRLDTQKPKDDD